MKPAPTPPASDSDPRAARRIVSQPHQPPRPSAGTVVISRDAKLLEILESLSGPDAGIDRQRLYLVKRGITAGGYPLDAGRLSQRVASLAGLTPPARDPLIEQHVEFARDASGRELTITSTGPRGRGRTLHSTVTYDRENSTMMRDVTRTGSQGHQVQRHAQITRTEDGFTNDLTVTMPDGRSLERHVEQTYDPDGGVLTRQVSLSNPDGRTVTKTLEVQLPDGDGSDRMPPVMPPETEASDA
jgi:hypothetical protein